MNRLNELRDMVRIANLDHISTQVDKGQVVRGAFSFKDFEVMVKELEALETALLEAADKLWLAKWYSNDEAYKEAALRAVRMINEARGQ